MHSATIVASRKVMNLLNLRLTNSRDFICKSNLQSLTSQQASYVMSRRAGDTLTVSVIEGATTQAIQQLGYTAIKEQQLKVETGILHKCDVFAALGSIRYKQLNNSFSIRCKILSLVHQLLP